MGWVIRNAAGEIVAAYTYLQEDLLDVLEMVPDDDPAFVAAINPPPPPEPSKEDLLAQIAALQAKVAALP